MNVLHICANPRPTEESVSKQLAMSFFSRLVEKNPDVTVNNVDLYQEQPPYVDLNCYRRFANAASNPEYKPSKGEEQAGRYANNQAEALRQADVLVLTMPMWSGGPPAIMKAWMDQVFQPGLLYTNSPEGLKMLHQLRRVVVLIASGDVYKEGDPRDGITTMMQNNFSFIGVTDVAYAWADGQDANLHSDSAERKGMAVEAAQDLADEIAELP